ncbi:MAG: hypothetical protein ACLRWM_08570 [Streptococcus sp.]
MTAVNLSLQEHDTSAAGETVEAAQAEETESNAATSKYSRENCNS